MINVNQLTQQLRMLPDAVLQRVAMMYKQDPYIFPMVISEDMARKKLRASAQAQAVRPQPKVNDQAIASLGYTPEEVGIAGLQAPNMQNMADGGIAGQADEMEFAERSEPVVRMAEGGVARYAGQADSLVRLPNAAVPFYSSQLQSSSDPMTELHRQAYMFEAERLDAEKELAAAEAALQRYGVRQRQTDPEGYAQAVAARDAAAKRRDTAAKKYAQESGRLPPKDEAERAFKKPTAITADEAKIYSGLYASAPQAPMMPIPEVKIAGQASAPAPAPAPAASSAPGITPTPAATGPGRAEQLLGQTERDTMRRLNALRMEAQQRGDEEQVMFEANKPKGKVAEGLEALLKQQEAAEPKEREQAKAMAIFNAGLAMMAGNSPYALQNIAKGAMAGTSEYAGAMKEFKQAAKERMKMQADIEQARRAEERDDSKTALSLFMRANDRMAKVEDHMADAGLKLGLSKADIAAKMEITGMELGSRERIAGAQIKANDPLALFRVLGDGDVKKGYEFAQTTKAEPSLVKQLAVEAVKNPASLTVLKQTNPDLYNAVMTEVSKIGGGAAGMQAGDRALVEKYLNKP